jgi:hypothetical protein
LSALELLELLYRVRFFFRASPHNNLFTSNILINRCTIPDLCAKFHERIKMRINSEGEPKIRRIDLEKDYHTSRKCRIMSITITGAGDQVEKEPGSWDSNPAEIQWSGFLLEVARNQDCPLCRLVYFIMQTGKIYESDKKGKPKECLDLSRHPSYRSTTGLPEFTLSIGHYNDHRIAGFIVVHPESVASLQQNISPEELVQRTICTQR